jgi:hypothetical protein
MQQNPYMYGSFGSRPFESKPWCGG